MESVRFKTPEIPAALRGLIVSDPEMLSGWPSFAGVRMPLQVLVDNLRAGSTPAQFIEDYGDSVTVEQIATVQVWLETLPPWDGDRDRIPEPYRFMFQEEPR